MSDEYQHCRHTSCCQCGANAGTPEHDADCIDAVLCRAMKKHSEGLTRRKLSTGAK